MVTSAEREQFNAIRSLELSDQADDDDETTSQRRRRNNKAMTELDQIFLTLFFHTLTLLPRWQSLAITARMTSVAGGEPLGDAFPLAGATFVDEEDVALPMVEWW